MSMNVNGWVEKLLAIFPGQAMQKNRKAGDIKQFIHQVPQTSGKPNIHSKTSHFPRKMQVF